MSIIEQWEVKGISVEVINMTPKERPERRADLLKVLSRGLNTWSPPIPQWLLDLQRELTNERK